MSDAVHKTLSLVLLNSTGDVIHSWSIDTSEPSWESEVQFAHIPLIEAIREYMSSKQRNTGEAANRYRL